MVVFGDQISRCWEQIIHHGEAGGDGQAMPTPHHPTAMAPSTPATPVVSPIDDDEDDAPRVVELPDGQRLVRDSRGVHLASDEEAD